MTLTRRRAGTPGETHRYACRPASYSLYSETIQREFDWQAGRRPWRHEWTAVSDVFDRNRYNVWRKWRNGRFREFGPSYTYQSKQCCDRFCPLVDQQSSLKSLTSHYIAIHLAWFEILYVRLSMFSYIVCLVAYRPRSLYWESHITVARVLQPCWVHSITSPVMLFILPLSLDIYLF